MAVGTLDLGLPHLTVVDRIGRGGFSVVYKAVDNKLNRPVAVKVLTGAVDRAGLERFEQECQIHGPLSNHPNIVTIHDAGLTPTGSPFLVMEYLDGGSLTDHLEANGPLPWRQAIEWMVPICDAVDSAHRMGVLHRDIKPANILVAAEGPKLADFGIACVTDATSPQFAVSWLHAPPESELNRRDERSDVYSLASTLFELLTGAAPFWREGDESLAALLTRLATAPAPHLSPATAPPFLDHVLQRALAKDPAERPATAAEFAATLVAGLEGTGAGGAPAAAPGPWAAGQGIDPSMANGVTALLPTATQILPAVALSPQPHPLSSSNPGPQPHPLSSSNPGPHTGPQPQHLSVSTIGNGGQHPGWYSSTAGGGGSFSNAGDRPDDPPRRRRSRKLPVAAAIIALATVGFLLSPAWGALSTSPSPAGDAITEPTSDTAAGSDANGGATATTDGSVATTEAGSTDASTETTDPDTTATTDDPDTTDTTDDRDPTATTDDPDTTETTDTPDTTDAVVGVPDVANLDAVTAGEVLAEAGFTNVTAVDVASDSVDAGLVIDTDPGAGTTANPADLVTLRVSTGPQLVTVPPLEGLTPDAAIAALDELGLEATIEVVELEGDDTLDGLVTGTFPGAGEEVAAGSTVVVGVGEAPVGPVVTIDPEIVAPTVVTIPPTTLDIAAP